MKLTEDEAKAKLEQVGLPTHGTHDELIARLEVNGLVEKTVDHKGSIIPMVPSNAVEQPKRGRPKAK